MHKSANWLTNHNKHAKKQAKSIKYTYNHAQGPHHSPMGPSHIPTSGTPYIFSHFHMKTTPEPGNNPVPVRQRPPGSQTNQTAHNLVY